MTYSKWHLFHSSQEHDEPTRKKLTSHYDAIKALTTSMNEARLLNPAEMQAVQVSLSNFPETDLSGHDFSMLASEEFRETISKLDEDNKKKLIQLIQEKGLNEGLSKLKKMLKEKSAPLPVKEINEFSEENDMLCGEYRRQLYQFTYDLIDPNFNIFECGDNTVFRRMDHSVYPLVNRPGFRCTVAIADTLTDPVEIQINFFGTIDFASKHADIDEGGPGQETLKKYEKELLIKINNMIKDLDTGGKPIRLKLAGHSLGGALAKGFTHTIQRACAVQEQEPNDIIDTIVENSKDQNLNMNRARLHKKLSKDKQSFAGLNHLSKITGVTIYALGAPGVSKETDQDATALSYFQGSDFLRVYNHYHEKDLIRKFGDTEFLSGTYGRPNVTTHKSLIYQYEISPEERDRHEGLPFPHIGPTVMAQHNASVNSNINHKIINTLDDEEEKFTFPAYLWLLYRIAFFIGAQCAKIIHHKDLFSYAESDVVEPTLQINKPS